MHNPKEDDEIERIDSTRKLDEALRLLKRFRKLAEMALDDLTPKEREVLERRFGIKK